MVRVVRRVWLLLLLLELRGCRDLLLCLSLYGGRCSHGLCSLLLVCLRVRWRRRISVRGGRSQLASGGGGRQACHGPRGCNANCGADSRRRRARALRVHWLALHDGAERGD